MKKILKLLGVICLICALVVMQLPASEATASSEASDFSIYQDTVLTKYVGTSPTVVIPDGIQTIATDAFKDNTIVKNVVIPKSVTKIEPYAFWGSSITTVTIGGGLKEIGDYAFANCKYLTKVSIPENVERIGVYAFEDNISLTDATITYKTMDIHESAFDGCYKLVIHAPEGSYPYKYAQSFYIRQQEFNEYEDVIHYNPDGTVADDSNGGGNNGGNDNSNTTSGNGSSIHFIYNPDGTVSSQTDYSSITEGDNSYGSVHVVGNQAVFFMDSSSPNVYSGSNPPSYGDAESENGSSENNSSGNNSSGGNSGVGNGNGLGSGVTSGSALSKYTIVDERIVADQAYYCNTTLNYVVLPSTIKEIGQFAYARSSVSSIVLPKGLERISYGAFYHCDNLASITIPDTVMYVEPNAFTHTAWVDAFLTAGSDEGDYLISGGVLVAYKGNSKKVVIPDGVRSIAAQVFANHTEITSVELPKSLAVIGEEAFCGCSNLSEINLDSSSVKYILDRAFLNTKLEKSVLPSALVAMGISAFNKDTVLFYLGSAPELTHENTAERLSNSELRELAYSTNATDINMPGTTGTANGVTVVGSDDSNNIYGIEAYLEAADDKYILTVDKVDSRDKFNKAKERAAAMLEGRSLIDGSFYEFELTDKSGIPITKLGKVGLTIAIPVPDSINDNTKLTVMTIDRNGQLEELACETISVEGKRYVRFTTYHLSPFAIYSTGKLLQDGELIVTNEVISALAATPVSDEISEKFADYFLNWLSVKKWRLLIASAFVAGGIVLLAYRKKRI